MLHEILIGCITMCYNFIIRFSSFFDFTLDFFRRLHSILSKLLFISHVTFRDKKKYLRTTSIDKIVNERKCRWKKCKFCDKVEGRDAVKGLLQCATCKYYCKWLSSIISNQSELGRYFIPLKKVLSCVRWSSESISALSLVKLLDDLFYHILYCALKNL